MYVISIDFELSKHKKLQMKSLYSLLIAVKRFREFFCLHFVLVLVCFSSTKEAIFYAFIESLLNWLMVEM